MGLLAVGLIHLHPENLRAPAWVAYAAASAFVLAGLCILAGAAGVARLGRWLALAVATSLLAVSLWVAIGVGERECSLSLSFMHSTVPDLMCRGAFGLGALLVGLFIVLAIRRGLGARRET
jgi:hypothetical protein